eukprot:3837369-Pyramimonas_sp.AAC.1
MMVQCKMTLHVASCARGRPSHMVQLYLSGVFHAFSNTYAIMACQIILSRCAQYSARQRLSGGESNQCGNVLAGACMPLSDGRSFKNSVRAPG